MAKKHSLALRISQALNEALDPFFEKYGEEATLNEVVDWAEGQKMRLRELEEENNGS